MAIAAFQFDLSLVPLVLVIGMASHWPAVGWMYGTRIYSVHAVVRVVLAVAIWFLWSEARFTALPIEIGVLYAIVVLAPARSPIGALARIAIARGLIRTDFPLAKLGSGSEPQLHRTAGANGKRHQHVQTELLVLATDEIRYARLCHAKFRRGLRLRPAFGRDQLAQRHHQFGTQRQYSNFVGRESEVNEHIP